MFPWNLKLILPREIILLHAFVDNSSIALISNVQHGLLISFRIRNLMKKHKKIHLNIVNNINATVKYIEVYRYSFFNKNWWLWWYFWMNSKSFSYYLIKVKGHHSAHGMPYNHNGSQIVLPFDSFFSTDHKVRISTLFEWVIALARISGFVKGLELSQPSRTSNLSQKKF